MNLFLLCGKPGCGKSTVSNYMQKKYGMIGLSADDFMLNLFGEIEDRNEFEEKLNKTKQFIYSLAKRFLQNGNRVVLDFGFWTKSERESVRQVFKDFDFTFVYIDKNQEEIFKCVEKRNANLKDNEYYMDKNVFELLCSKFEVPENEENVITICGSRFENVEEFMKNYL